MKSSKRKRQKPVRKPKRAVDQALVAWSLHRIQGKTLVAIAEKLGYSRNTISQYVKRIDEKIDLRGQHAEQENRLFSLIDDAFTSLGIHVDPKNASNKDLSNYPAARLILSATGHVVERKDLKVGADTDLLAELRENRAKAAEVFGVVLPGQIDEGEVSDGD